MQDTKLPLEPQGDGNQNDSQQEPTGTAGGAQIEGDDHGEPQQEGGGEGEPETSPKVDAGPTPSGEPQLPAERAPARLEAHSDGVQAIIPRDEQEVSRLAGAIIASGIVPKAFKYGDNVRDENDKIIHRKGEPNKPLIAMGILKSLEIGLPPLTGLSYLLPINDRFTIWGDGAVALAQSKGLIANQFRNEVGPPVAPNTELADWPDEHGVEVRYIRKGQNEAYVGRYTVADAKRAKLWMNSDKKPWILYPDRMLFNRARAFALRDGFADALSGLAIAEEVRDMTPEPVDGGELKVSPRKSALLDDGED